MLACRPVVHGLQQDPGCTVWQITQLFQMRNTKLLLTMANDSGDQSAFSFSNGLGKWCSVVQKVYCKIEVAQLSFLKLLFGRFQTVVLAQRLFQRFPTAAPPYKPLSKGFRTFLKRSKKIRFVSQRSKTKFFRSVRTKISEHCKKIFGPFQIPHNILLWKPKKKRGGVPLQIEFFWVQKLPGGAVLKCGARVTNDCTDNPAGKADPPGQGANPKSSCPRAPA